MIVLPKKEKYDTLLSMKYSTDGVRRNNFQIFYYKNFSGEQGKSKLIFVVVAGWLMIILILGVAVTKLAHCCCKDES